MFGAGVFAKSRGEACATSKEVALISSVSGSGTSLEHRVNCHLALKDYLVTLGEKLMSLSKPSKRKSKAATKQKLTRYVEESFLPFMETMDNFFPPTFDLALVVMCKKARDKWYQSVGLSITSKSQRNEEVGQEREQEIQKDSAKKCAKS
ncbi:hypothetical protein KY290_012976 [Solanum tuberosum]|uniref:Uncharacterized protein n=1 Tax=Solanum tuberosum TaxID=4113 RepID=A0ABQ7VL36_SOLTU|nr:hypothetical protein KY285_012740 [Solanum tuberosum]KAH0768995.1 hypothetical protein KY290_012976 [Solanum tuberosum]